MKKYIIGLLIVIIAVGAIVLCMKFNEQSNSLFNYWTDDAGAYKGDIISDKKSAMEIATAIYNNIPKSGKEKEYVAQNAIYDAQYEIWVVTFGDNNPNVAGGGCSIALQKKDGKVVKISFGE